MLILRVSMTALPEKLHELKQAILFMISRIREETLCSAIHAYEDLEDENRVLFCSRWENRDSLDAYLRSDRFRALLGTKILLSGSPVAFVDNVASSNGMESIAAIRSISEDIELQAAGTTNTQG
jgi:quinol monooxygenase YgiN